MSNYFTTENTEYTEIFLSDLLNGFVFQIGV